MPAEIKSLKVLKEHNRQEILFSLARVPNSSRLFLGASDGKVYEVDALEEKPEFLPHEGHSSFVTGLAIAGEHARFRQLRRQAHLAEARRRRDRAHGRCSAHPLDSQSRRFARWQASWPASQTIWSAASGTQNGKCVTNCAGTRSKRRIISRRCSTPAPSPPMANSSPRPTASGRFASGTSASGKELETTRSPGLYTWDPKQRIHSIGGIRSVAFSPDGQTLAVGGIGRIGNIDHLDGPARVEVFDWEQGEKLHEFSGDGKGLIEHLLFHPNGDWLVGLGGDNGGLIQFYDVAAKKIVKSEKAPMHIHAACLSDESDKLFACGHGRLVVWEVA